MSFITWIAMKVWSWFTTKPKQYNDRLVIIEINKITSNNNTDDDAICIDNVELVENNSSTTQTTKSRRHVMHYN